MRFFRLGVTVVVAWIGGGLVGYTYAVRNAAAARAHADQERAQQPAAATCAVRLNHCAAAVYGYGDAFIEVEAELAALTASRTRYLELAKLFRSEFCTGLPRRRSSPPAIPKLSPEAALLQTSGLAARD